MKQSEPHRYAISHACLPHSFTCECSVQYKYRQATYLDNRIILPCFTVRQLSCTPQQSMPSTQHHQFNIWWIKQHSDTLTTQNSRQTKNKENIHNERAISQRNLMRYPLTRHTRITQIHLQLFASTISIDEWHYYILSIYEQVVYDVVMFNREDIWATKLARLPQEQL